MYRFGASELDPHRRELRRDGRAVHLEPQAFDLLVYLVRQRDRVVPNSELLNAVWGHEYLSDSVLTTRVKEVRRAVGDDGRAQAVVRNFRARGYRFVADVEADPGDDVAGDAATGKGDASSGHQHAVPRSAAEAGLLGRDDDARLVMAALADHRLVTITGPGGVGKSALARAVASMVDGRFDDGVHLVDLSVTDPGEPLLPVVARVLEIAFTPDRAEAALRAAARLDALLVVDGCDSHVGAVGALVEALLTMPGAAIRVLATSRVRLGLGTEFVARLTPLHPSVSADLFELRAAATTRRGSEIPARDQVEKVVAKLDHLPLAIEMAAARLGTMSLGELEAALDGDGALTSLAVGGQQRHRGFDDLVAGNLGMLSADQSALFLDCSVFAGWFDSADAAAVSAAVRTEPTVMSLSWLAECSLLQSTTGDGTTRYRMLATVRSVAQARLAAEGGTASVAQRHADWVLGRLRGFDSALRSSPEPVQRSVLDGLVDEARVVNRWAQATDPALGSEVCGLLHLPAYTGLWHEPADWGRRLMEAGVDAPGTRVAIAGLETHRGNLGRAKALLEGDAATATGRERVNALEVLSDAALYGGDLDVALELAALMSDEGTRHSDPYAVAMGTVFTALARAYGGRVDEALEALERARPFSLAPAAARGWLHYTLGEVLALQSRFGAASDELQHAVAHGSRIEHRYLVSVARATLATVLGRSGDYKGAFAAMGECLRDCRRNGNMVHAVTAMRNLVDLLVKSGRDSEAVVVWAGAATADWGGSYGSESDTVRDAVSKAGARLGMSTFEQCRREGEQLGVHGALDRAIDVIARLLP